MPRTCWSAVAVLGRGGYKPSAACPSYPTASLPRCERLHARVAAGPRGTTDLTVAKNPANRSDRPGLFYLLTF